MIMKFNFLKPVQKKILIFDNSHSKILKSFFKGSENEVDILYTRYEKINLYVLLMVLIKLKPFKNISYLQQYVDYVKPKIIITMIDNDRNFYRLKFPNAKKIFIQNGRRTKLELYNDTLHSIKSYNVDMMFVHNDLVGKEYKKIIKGKTCSVGSVYSNTKKILKKNKKKKELIYVSTFRTSYLDEKSKIYNNIKWKDYIRGEIKLLKALNKFLTKNDYKLTILGKYNYPQFIDEKSFFLKYFDKKKIKILKNFPTRNHFKYIDLATLIIGNDSTLCYEAFGRGNKVLFFGIRGKSNYLKSRNFAYPLKTPDKSIFWDNTLKFDNINKSIKDLINMPSNKWQKYFQRYKNSVMHYDYDNYKIKKYINEIKIS